MAYDKQTWDTTSYVNPTRMNHIESGIEAASTTAESSSAGVSAINTKIGTTDISEIGDGKITGAISSLNSNLTQLFEVGTSNGWNYRKWSNGYFEAWKKDTRNVTGQSKTVMGITGNSFTKVVSYPSFVTNFQQIISAISNVKVGSGYTVQVFQNLNNSGISVESMSNTTGEQSYESTHYIYGRLSTTLSAPPTE